MLSDDQVEFVDRSYGKNYVRLLVVRKHGTFHQMKELEVCTKLTLNSTKDYVHGDNSDIVATDSQKNTVYILAKKHGVMSIESFGLVLAAHFLKQYSHVDKASIYIEEKPWHRIRMGEKEHSHSFIEGSDGTRFCNIVQHRNTSPLVSAGIKDLKVLKTTKSSFVNFVRDEYRSLPDMDDRIFCSVVYAKWDYSHIAGLNFNTAWSKVKESILDVFCGPVDTGIDSPSVQKTLYDTQKLCLARIPQMSQIHIELPNVHSYEFDFSKYPGTGIARNGEVFQPTDKPSGNIQATLRRCATSKL